MILTIDRRASYYARSASERAADPLEFQRRYMAGIAILRMLRVRVSAFGAKRQDNILPLRKQRA
jgi:hypothetical protein